MGEVKSFRVYKVAFPGSISGYMLYDENWGRDLLTVTSLNVVAEKIREKNQELKPTDTIVIDFRPLHDAEILGIHHHPCRMLPLTEQEIESFMTEISK